MRAAAEPELRAARHVGLAGARRLRLPGDAQHVRDHPGRGPGDADARTASSARPHADDGQQTDPTGSTCADAAPGGHAGRLASDCTSDRSHVGGIPNGFQGSSGCRLPEHATAAGGCARTRSSTGSPAAVGVQPVARADPLPGAALRDARLRPDAGRRPARTPAASAPTAPAPRRCRSAATASSARRTATPRSSRSTRRRARRCSRTTATRCRSRPSDLAGGILVTGSSANHTVADPTNEASTGFIDRDAVNPLQQLKALSGNPNAFTFVPANDPTGAARAVHGRRTTRRRPGRRRRRRRRRRAARRAVSSARRARPSRRSPTTRSTRRSTTRPSAAGQLAGGKAYRWSGWVYVPTADTYTLGAAVQLDGAERERHVRLRQQREPGDRRARDAHAGQRPDDLRRDGAGHADERRLHRGAADEPGLLDRHHGDDLRRPARRSAGTRSRSRSTRARSRRRSASGSRTRASNGDIADAAAAAVGKSKAIVFVNTGSGVSSSAAVAGRDAVRRPHDLGRRGDVGGERRT